MSDRTSLVPHSGDPHQSCGDTHITSHTDEVFSLSKPSLQKYLPLYKFESKEILLRCVFIISG